VSIVPDSETADDSALSERKLPARIEPRLVLVCECDRLLARGASWSLRDVGEIVFGRGARREVVRAADGLRVSIPSRSASSVHARLRLLDGEWVLEDAESRNGTFVDGKRITRATVHEGEVIELGRALFVLERASVERDGIDIDAESTVPEAPGLATLSPELGSQYAALGRIARSNISVLLLGETGSGKEVLARAVHALSQRGGRFVAVNCGALPQSLVEAQLFGHVKGAFSGALRDEPGLVRAADGGTLFLDEIGDLPPSSQAALLRVLQEREVLPVGSTHAVRVDLRVVAATHRSLSREAARGAFRSDLLARLSGFTLDLPPLRRRKHDLGVLIADLLHGLEGYSERGDVARVTLTPTVGRALLAYDWPHNVRELQQALAAALVLADDGAITSATLPPAIAAAIAAPAPRASIAAPAPRASIAAPAPRASIAAPAPNTSTSRDDEQLRLTLVEHLRTHCGNVAAVARAMGKAPMQVHRWMKRFALDPADYR
jgi:sigma-54 dependent transcriptional regulator, acetoin dehydrogenase operon transcriptional activator AcoR